MNRSGSQQDVDLFISVLDARYPTSEDYDYSSNNLGPDDVIIRSNDSFWANSGYNASYGVVFVIGVKALTENVNYSLMMTGPSRYQVSYQYLNSTWQTISYTPTVTKGVVLPPNQVHVYKWYNWGGRNQRLNIGITAGSVQIYYNTYSESFFT